MRRPFLSRPTRSVSELVLTAAAGMLVVVASLGNLSLAFKTAGLDGEHSIGVALAMVFLSIALSPVNIPVAEYETRISGSLYPGPFPWEWGAPVIVGRTLIAVNAGGFLVPAATASTLVALSAMRNPLVLPAAVLSTALASMLVQPLSRVVPGVGVMIPGFYPPLAALVSSMMTAWPLGVWDHLPVLAYVAGVYGTIIGADLLNLGKIVRSGVRVVSIGGLGTFDGVYLSGVLAVALSSLVV